MKQSCSRDNESKHKSRGQCRQLGKVVCGASYSAVPHAIVKTDRSRTWSSGVVPSRFVTHGVFSCQALVVLVVRQLPEGSRTIVTLTPISHFSTPCKVHSCTTAATVNSGIRLRPVHPTVFAQVFSPPNAAVSTLLPTSPWGTGSRCKATPVCGSDSIVLQ